MSLPFKKQDLKRKVCIITGASDGIGVPTAKVIASCGAHTIIAARNLEKAQKVADDIIKETGNKKVEVMHLDLGSLASVREFVEEFKKKGLPLHLLINNAGIFVAGTAVLTVDGFEQQFQVNHLSHFLLTNLLLDIIVQSASNGVGARIINVSSESHRNITKGLDFDNLNGEKNPYPALTYWYEQSKLCNVLFSNELNRRLSGKGVTVNSLHPGTMINTNISATNPFYIKALFYFGNLFGLTKTVEQGAWTTLTVALDPQYATEGGLYLNNSLPVDPSPEALDVELQKKLWDVSEKLSGLVSE